MARLKLGNWIASVTAWRDRDLTSTGGIVVQAQFGQFSPAKRRHFVWKNGRLSTHNGRVSVAMDPRYAKTQHPTRAVNG